MEWVPVYFSDHFKVGYAERWQNGPSIMLIFGKNKKKKQTRKKTFTDKKKNGLKFTENSCKVAAFFLLLFFLNIYYTEIAFPQQFFDSCEISYLQPTDQFASTKVPSKTRSLSWLARFFNPRFISLSKPQKSSSQIQTLPLHPPPFPTSHIFFFFFHYLQHLELPGVLVFVVQTVSGIEIELPGSLVLVVQTVDSSEAQRGRRVALRGERSWGLAEGPPHGGGGDGAQGAPCPRQLRVHGGQVGAAVQAGEVGGGACVALAVGGGLGVGHGVGGGALHAGGGGGRQGVWQRGDGGRAPDGDRSTGWAGAGGDGGAWGRRGWAVGSIGGVGTSICVGFPGWGSLLLGGPWFGLARALLLLLAALCTSVFEPDLGEERESSRSTSHSRFLTLSAWLPFVLLPGLGTRAGWSSGPPPPSWRCPGSAFWQRAPPGRPAVRGWRWCVHGAAYAECLKMKTSLSSGFLFCLEITWFSVLNV